MLNSVLLYFSCYNNKPVIKFSAILLCFINLISVNTTALFKSIVWINIAIYAFILLLAYNKKLNIFVSTFSILIYGIIIDFICYYFYPLFEINVSVFEYIFNGIMFNLKFCILPILFTTFGLVFKNYKYKFYKNAILSINF